MKILLVSGTRNDEFTTEEVKLIEAKIGDFAPDLLLHGACGCDGKYVRKELKGVDRIADHAAEWWEVPVLAFPAKWSEYKKNLKRHDWKSAGPDRNADMAEIARRHQRYGHDVRWLCVPRGRSPGTRGCVRIAEAMMIPFEVLELKP